MIVTKVEALSLSMVCTAPANDEGLVHSYSSVESLLNQLEGMHLVKIALSPIFRLRIIKT